MWNILRRTLACTILCCFSLASMADRVDLNSADAMAIAEAMQGVGPVKAAEIVRDRHQNGLFANVNELLRVQGTGPKTIEKNRSRLTVR